MLEKIRLDETIGLISDGITSSIAERSAALNRVTADAEYDFSRLMVSELAGDQSILAETSLTEILLTETLATEPLETEASPPHPIPEQPFFSETIFGDPVVSDPSGEPLQTNTTPTDLPTPTSQPDALSPESPQESQPLEAIPTEAQSPTAVPSELAPSDVLAPEALSPPQPLSPDSANDRPSAGSDLLPTSDPRFVELSNSGNGSSALSPAFLQPWQPRTTWVVIHGWNSDPETFAPTANAIQRARGNQDTVLLLDWRQAAQSGGDGLGGLQSGGNFKAARSVASVADWATQALRDWGISDAEAQTQLNFVGHSLGAYVSAEIAARFEGGVNSIFALDPASEFNAITGFGYDFDNDGDTERPTRFDSVSRLSRSFVGARSPAGNQTVSGWAHESYEMDFGLGLLRPPGSEHRWVYGAFANLIDDDNAIANRIGVKNLAPVSGWAKDGFSRRHEGRLFVNDRSLEVERLVVKSGNADQDDWVYGTQRGDDLYGGWGRDSLFGGVGRDRLRGGQGNDTLVGGPGGDQLWGGGGQDEFHFSAEDVSTTIEDADTIHDFATGGRFRSAETISLGAGLSLAEIALETGTGDYAGDTLIRHGDEFLARLVGVGIGEVSIAKNFTQLPQP